MAHEVIVVGGGIGGLTTAAILAARGVDVCLFERNESVGGCVANFQYQGYTFEPTAGLYAGWEPGGIHQRIFAELPVNPPEVRRVLPAYAVRLPDQTQIAVDDDPARFEQGLRNAFPESADAPIRFYDQLSKLDKASAPTSEPITRILASASPRFRSFIDAQLQIFRQSSVETCSIQDAASALLSPRKGLFAIHGGAQAQANALMESIRKSGGTVRLNSPVLRLVYDDSGALTGVDLLSGERVTAQRAIVSNLTVWDTYGKLVGLQRTPAEILAELRSLNAWGAYLLFLSLDDSTSNRLPSEHVLAVTLQDHEHDNTAERQFIFSVAPTWDTRAPAGKRAVTICTLTNVEDWFVFHEDATEHERMDQETLESWWAKLHAAMPELGASVEIIETVTPKTFYELTRRKLGMVGATSQRSNNLASHLTPFPNLFIVGDTVSSNGGLAAVSQSAQALTDALTS